MPCQIIGYEGIITIKQLASKLSSRQPSSQGVEGTVRSILDRVKEVGDDALVEYTRKFDCEKFSAEMLRVSSQVMEDAFKEVPAGDLDIIRESAANIRVFHERQKRNSWFVPSNDGTILGQMILPVERAGLYVPGGKGGDTPLISSMLMNAIPAQVAGVERIVAVTPPRADGSVNPYILAAAKLLGLEEVFAVGSAWAIAALAYGTDSLPAVDVVAGPGNIFVTTAKRMVSGTVGIDMIAGPSEIVVLADGNANPRHLAADLLSQAEHDPMAACVLVSTSDDLTTAVAAELKKQLASLPRTEIAGKSLRDWGAIVTVPGLTQAVEAVNILAPEHLEIVVENAWDILGGIRNAGAVFLGPNTPEPVGDYFAGPNHVLPTMGTARFSSALSVDTFTKKTSVISASREFIDANVDKIARLARLEGLEAHARSAESRKI